MKKALLSFIFIQLFATVSFAQENNIWQKTNENNLKNLAKSERNGLPSSYQLFSLDLDVLKSKLATAPSRENFKTQKGIVIAFPNADGNLEKFSVYEASIMEPKMAVKYSDIQSYVGIGIDDPTATIRFSTTIFGLHTMTFSGKNETSYIDTYTKDLKNYIVYAKSALPNKRDFKCEITHEDEKEINFTAGKTNPTNSILANTGIFRTYRLVVSTTIEYSNFHIAAAGLNTGTAAQKRAAVFAAQAVTMVRVNGLYERDLSITLRFVAGSDILISIDTDNFNNNSGSQLLSQNQAYVNTFFGAGDYDIGHIFSTGGGGVASLGSVCNPNQKARGVTGSSSPVGDAFDVDYVAHEMGHQFGATHTYNNSCGGNITASTAVEPGSGTTIMAYAGICPPDIQNNSDSHFSVVSLAQIDAFVAGSGNCSVNVPNNNPAPFITPIPNYTIPVGTAFVLKGNATDANNPNTLTYCWEQTDTDISSQPPSNFSDFGPNFRSRPPATSPDRYMPALSSVIANNLTPTWEVVPSVPRFMNFALTVRDNASPNGSQTNRDDITVTFAGSAPFLVLTPNTNVSWPAGSNQNVTWDVAGTTANGINTPFVDIFLSTNGGSSFPILLASGVPNDGSETITVPNNIGTANRIMVMGNKNIFYDVSNTNFSITAANPASNFSIGFNNVADQQNKTVCQGSSVIFPISYLTYGGFASNVTLTATGNPAGTTISFSQNPINTTGNSNLTITSTTATAPGLYTIVVTGTSGTITKSVNYYYQVFSASFQAVTLSTPANNTVVTPTGLSLNWASSAGATLYEVQVATNNTFTNIIASATVSTTNYTVNGLLSSVDYFWRVAPKNSSCTGAFSSSFKFSTIFCGVFTSTDIPIAIPSTGTPTVNSTLTITAANNVVINDVNVTLNISHTWINDITATLISPAGTEIQLFTNQCSPTVAGAQNAVATFDDSGIVLVCNQTTPPSVSGTVIPAQLLAGLNGQNSQGVWTLRVFDKANQDGGTINSWGLNICSNNAPLSTIKNETFNFSVYPNPNNGSFNVQLGNLTSEKVKIVVYDTLGRMIFNKDYSSQANFNQNIQLQNVQAGIYLVNVVDGNRKETKRIVVE